MGQWQYVLFHIIRSLDGTKYSRMDEVKFVEDSLLQ